MGDRTLNPGSSFNNEQVLDIARSIRVEPPARYTLKIKSFSQLTEIIRRTGVEKYDSVVFEAGGYKWKLVLYPYGNVRRNANGHISLYLALAETNPILNGCQVDVTLKFFVYNQIQDNYITIQDGRVKWYHALKTQHGFHQLLPLRTFNDSSNGYLIDDCCAFGVEVNFLKFTGQGEEFSIIMVEPQEHCRFTWKIERFSTIESQLFFFSSQPFSAAGYKWKLLLHPKGDCRELDRSLSLFLTLNDYGSHLRQKVYVECELSVKDQINGSHEKVAVVNNWFLGLEYSWGFSSLMLLNELHDESNGFLVDDTLIIEAKIIRVSAVEALIC